MLFTTIYFLEDDYILKACTELDAQGCRETTTVLAALFQPAMQKAMIGQPWLRFGQLPLPNNNIL